MSVQAAEYPNEQAVRAAVQSAEYPSEQDVRAAVQSAEYPSEQDVRAAVQSAEYPSEQNVRAAVQSAEYPSEQNVRAAVQSAEYPSEQNVRAAVQSAEYPSEQAVHAHDATVKPALRSARQSNKPESMRRRSLTQIPDYPTEQPLERDVQPLSAEEAGHYPVRQPVKPLSSIEVGKYADEQPSHAAAKRRSVLQSPDYPTEQPLERDVQPLSAEEAMQFGNEYPTEPAAQVHDAPAAMPESQAYPAEEEEAAAALHAAEEEGRDDGDHEPPQQQSPPHDDGDEAAKFDPDFEQPELDTPLEPDMDAVNEQLAADAAEEAEEVEAAKAAVEAQAEEEADIEERRQLCSEIVGLRKELKIVKEDEANLRTQLVHTRQIIHTHDPALADELTRLEEQAAESQMAHLWQEQCQQHNPDKADWSTININDMPRRVNAVKEHFAETNALAAQLYSQLEVKINQHTDYREEVKTRMQQAYTDELTNTAPARARLHQIEDEKRYHAKRGTSRKAASATAIVPEEKKTMSRQRRIGTAEVRTAAEVDRLNGELSDLMAECKVLKQRLDNSRKMHAARQAEAATALANVRDSGATVRETKERLVKERQELQSLKADLQAVLHYVRAKQREENEL